MKNFIYGVFTTLIILTVIYYFNNIDFNNKIDIKNIVTDSIQDTTAVDTAVTDTIVIRMLPIDSTMYEIAKNDTVYNVVVGSFKVDMNAINFNNKIENSFLIKDTVFDKVCIYKSVFKDSARFVLNQNKETYKGIWIFSEIK
jgi:hypothetical protein